MKPKITVLLPVYNGEKYLCQAIDSILNQTLTDFELLIVDDGSRDNSVAIINSYRDARLKLIKQEHRGLCAALNRGLAAASGEYLARMDADDISLPQRLAEQAAFLDSQPPIGVCGADIITIDAAGQAVGQVSYAPDNETLQAELFFQSIMAHPTVMLRLALLRDNNINYRLATAEDYDLWAALSRLTKFANLNKPLLKYRLGTGISSNDLKLSYEQAAREVQRKLLTDNFFAPTAAELALHAKIHRRDKPLVPAEAAKLAAWLKKLISANRQRPVVNVKIFQQVAARQWFIFWTRFNRWTLFFRPRIFKNSCYFLLKLAPADRRQLSGKIIKRFFRPGKQNLNS